MDKESVEALLKLACDFQGESLKRREVSRETYLQNEEQHESSIRILIDGLMAKLTNVMIEKKIKDAYERKSYQINVLASVVRTHYLINNLIMDGDLVEAQILIRKQLESLTRLDELDSASLQQLPKGTPNVNNRFRNLYKTAYIPLSEVAHFGSPKVSRFLLQPTLRSGFQARLSGSVIPTGEHMDVREAITKIRTALVG